MYPKTKVIYTWFVFSTLCFGLVINNPFGTLPQVDHALVHCLDAAFECGEDGSSGQTTLAAFADALSEYCRGRLLSHHLPRTRRALQTWRRVDPSSPWLPLGWAITAVVCIIARVACGAHEAMCIACQFDIYARPQAF